MVIELQHFEKCWNSLHKDSTIIYIILISVQITQAGKYTYDTCTSMIINGPVKSGFQIIWISGFNY